MTLDLYAYGRAQRDVSARPDVHEAADHVFTCGGCGSSARTKDPELLRTLGWRLVPAVPSTVARKPLCPRCARRFIAGLV